MTAKINGRAFNTWAYASVKMSMETIGGYFIGTFPENMLIQETFKDLNIGMEDEITVEVNGWLILTGYIDEIISAYEIQEKGNTISSFSIIARDKTADLMDCSFAEKTNEYKGLTILSLIKKLCLPFNVTVKASSDVESLLSKKIETFKANEGETPFELITKMCRDIGVLPLSYGDGKLTLTKTSSIFKSTDSIVLGKNALYARMVNSNINRFKDYIVKGQGISSDNKESADYISASGKTTDSVMKRHRPYLSFAEDITDSGGCAQRAKWLARTRAGQSRKITYNLFQLTQQDGTAWFPNCEVDIVDSYHKIKETKLISEVEYEYEERGKNKIELAKITVVDKTMYDVSSTNKIKSVFDRD